MVTAPPASRLRLRRQADAPALAECPNYWVPRAVVEGQEPAATAAEQVVQHLYRRLAAEQLGPHGADFVGAEYWCQVGACGGGGRQPAAVPACMPALLGAATSPLLPLHSLQIYEKGRGLGWHVDKVGGTPPAACAACTGRFLLALSSKCRGITSVPARLLFPCCPLRAG